MDKEVSDNKDVTNPKHIKEEFIFTPCQPGTCVICDIKSHYISAETWRTEKSQMTINEMFNLIIGTVELEELKCELRLNLNERNVCKRCDALLNTYDSMKIDYVNSRNMLHHKKQRMNNCRKTILQILKPIYILFEKNEYFTPESERTKNDD